MKIKIKNGTTGEVTHVDPNKQNQTAAGNQTAAASPSLGGQSKSVTVNGRTVRVSTTPPARLTATQPQQQKTRQYVMTGDSAVDAENARRIQTGQEPVYSSTEDKRNQLRLDQGLSVSRNLTPQVTTPTVEQYAQVRDEARKKAADSQAALAALNAEFRSSAPTSGGQTTVYDPENESAQRLNDLIQQRRTLEAQISRQNTVAETANDIMVVDDIDRRGDTGLFEKLYVANTDLSAVGLSDEERKKASNDYMAAMEALKKRGYTQEQIKEYLTSYTRWADQENAEGIRGAVDEIAKTLPITATVGSVVLGLATAPVAAVGSMGLQSGRKNSPYQAFNIISQQTRQTVGEKAAAEASTVAQNLGVSEKAAEHVGKAAQWLYQAGASALESAIAMGTGGVLGEALMGLNAASQTYNDALNNGLDNGLALAQGVAAGIFESLFEHVSLENLRALQATGKKGFFNAVLDILKQFGTEGSEELATDIANELYDYMVNGGYSNYARTVAEVTDNGGTEAEAVTKYINDLMKQFGESFIVGGIAGGLGAGRIRAQQTGTRIAENIGTGRAVQTAGQYTEGGVQSVLQPLTEAVQGTDAGKALENITEKTGKYKTGEIVRNAVDQVQMETVKQTFEGVGIDEQTAEKKATQFLNIYKGNISAENVEQFLDLVQDEKSRKAIRDLLGSETENGKRNKALETFRRNVIKGAEQHRGILSKAAEKLDRFIRRDEIKKAEARGEIADESVKSVEAKTTGELVTATKANTSTGKATVKGISGITDGKVQVVVDESGATADLDDVTFADNDEGRRASEIYRGVQRMMQGGEAYRLPMSVEAANLAIAFAQNMDGRVADVLDALYTAYTAGRVAREAGSYKHENELDQGEAAFDAMYNAGIKEYKPAAGVTRLGTRNLTDTQTEELAVLDKVFQKLGIALVVTDTLKVKVNNKDIRLFGETNDKSKIIYVALSEDGKDNLISVAAFHELFHWLRYGGKTGEGVQRGLVKAVIRTIKNDANLNYDEIYEQRAELYKDATQEYIEEEIAAQYFGTLLSKRLLDSKMVKSIDKSAWEQIKDHLMGFITMVHDEIEKLAGRYYDKAMYAAINADYDAAVQLVKSFDIAIGVAVNEAKQNARQKTAEQTETKETKQSRVLDAEYMAAVEAGDEEAQARLVEQAARAAGYNRRFYHQTNADFTVFDTRHKGAGNRDNETPFGIFMKSTPENIGLRGEKQMPLFASIHNPLEVENRAALVKKLQQISEEFAAAYQKGKDIDNEYSKKLKDAKNAWMKYVKDNPLPEGKTRKDWYSDPEFNRLFNAEDAILKEWTTVQTEQDRKTKEIILQSLKQAGYDGVILHSDTGSWGRKTDAYIALEPEQVKSADPVTYDDDGNVIPLSERFNSEEPDIRYSRVLNQAATDYVKRMRTGSKERWEIVNIFREMADAQAAFRVLEEDAENMEKWRKIARKYAYVREGKNGRATPEQVEELAKQIDRAFHTIIDSGNIEVALYDLYKVARDQIERAGHYEVIADSLVKDFREEFRPNGKRVTIYIPENVVTDVSEYYGGKGAFRNAMYGMMNITYDSSQGMPLDEFYDSLVQNGYGLEETTDPSTQIRNMQALYNAYEETWVSDKEGYLENGLSVDEAATDAAMNMMTDMMVEGSRGSTKFKGWRKRIRELKEEIRTEQREGILKVLADADAELAARLEVLGAQDMDTVAMEVEAERLKKEYELRDMREAFEDETAQMRTGVNGNEMRMTDEQYAQYEERVAAARAQEKAIWSQINEDQQRWWQERYAATKGKWEGRYEQQQEWWKQRYAETKKNLESRYQGRYDEQQKWWQQRYADSKKIWEGKYADQQEWWKENYAKQQQWWREYYKGKLEEKQKWYQDSLIKDTRQRQIKQQLKPLIEMFTKDKKGKYIPLEMQHDVIAFIEMFSDDRHVVTSKGIQNLLNVARKSLADAGQEETSPQGYEYLFGRFDEGLKTELEELLTDLQRAEQDRADKRAEKGLPPAEHKAISIDGKVYTQFMTVEQLDTLLAVVTHIRTLVENVNVAFLDERRVNMEEFSQRQIASAEADAPGKLRDFMQRKLGTMPMMKMLTPIYFFNEVVGGPMGEIYEAIRNGQDKWMWRIMDAADAMKKARTDTKYGEWKDKTFVFHFDADVARKEWDVTMTADELIYIYALLEREMRSGSETEHLITGGIVMDNEVKKKTPKEWFRGLTKKGVEKTETEKLGRMVKAEAHQISYFELEAMIKELSPEMKAYGDALVKFLSTTCAAWGNETSVKLTGLKLFGESYYIPFISAKNYLHTRLGLMDDTRLRNAGFTKKLKNGANNPLIVKGISQVAMEHAEHMARYSSFAVPLDTLQRMFNYRQWRVDEEGNKTPVSVNVKTALQSAYGANVLDYINTFVTQLNGGVRNNTNDNIWNKFTGWFKRAAVMGNLSVVVQQPSAIARATALIDKRYFFGGFRKADYDDMMAHSAVANIKQMGGFDTMTGRSAVEWMLDDERKVTQKIGDIMSKGAEYADAAAWTNIWNAVKRETAAKHPDVAYGSDAYYEIVDKRFRDVIDYTQVYDSTLSKNELMRDPGALTKMVMAFQAEPSLSLNMLMVNGKKHKIKTANALAAFVLNIVINSALKSIVGAWRDEDEDETYWEKYLEKFFSDLIGDKKVRFLDGAWSPFGMIPWLKDLLSLWQGYNVDRSDVSVFNDLITSVQAFGNEMTDEDGNLTMPSLDTTIDLAGAISSMTPVPISKSLQDIQGIVRTVIENIVYDDMDTTAETAKRAILEGIGIEQTKADKAYNAVREGDKETESRYLAVTKEDIDKYANYKDPYSEARTRKSNSWHELVQKGLIRNDDRVKIGAEARYNMDSSVYEEMIRQITADGFDENDAVKAIETLFNKMVETEPKETKETAAAKKYTKKDLENALDRNDPTAFKELAKKAVEAGMKESTVTETAVKYAQAYFEDFGDASGAKKILKNFAGYSESQASSKVAYWKNPDGGVSADAWAKYYDKLAKTGISESVYEQYVRKSAACEGVDKNGDGKAEPNTKKEQVLEVINSLPGLTRAQKDELYRLNDYAESKLSEAPWHKND